MKSRILGILFVCAAAASAQWLQDDFAIMSNYDPTLNGVVADDEAGLRRHRDAGFNLLSGHNDNGGGPSYMFRASPLSQEYKLARVAAVGGLRSFVSDFRIFFREEPYQAGKMAVLADEYRNQIMPLTSRSVIYGYHFVDEPTIDHLKDRVLPNMSELASLEPGKAMMVNLGGSWRGKAAAADHDSTVTWEKYEAYVEHAFASPSAHVIAYDYYLHEDALSSNGYFPFPPGPGVTYYKHMRLFAEKAVARQKAFWGTPMSTPHAAGGRNYIIPSEGHLRFNAYSFLAYGAKGLSWFTYGLPGPRPEETYVRSPENDMTLYDWLTRVNREISLMGPVLMGLAWKQTVHSAATDIGSGEGGLPTFASSSVFAATNPIQWSCGTCSNSLAAGVFQGGGDDYLFFLNKTVDPNALASTAATLRVRGMVMPRYFNKGTGTFQGFVSTYDAASNTTSFSLSINRGDGVLVWLDKGTRVHALQQILF